MAAAAGVLVAVSCGGTGTRRRRAGASSVGSWRGAVLLLLVLPGLVLLSIQQQPAHAFQPPPPLGAPEAAVRLRTALEKPQQPQPPLPRVWAPRCAPMQRLWAATEAAAAPVAKAQAVPQGKEEGEDLSKKRLGRVEAGRLLDGLIAELRLQQGGDAASAPAPEAEAEPFYGLAQRCRLSGMPDMVLEVLNTYRAMASPGALRPGAPRTADVWTLIITAHAALGDVKLAGRVLEDAVRNGNRLALAPGDRGAAWRAGRVLEALVAAGPAGFVTALHVKEQLAELGVFPDYRFYATAIDAFWRMAPLASLDAMSDVEDWACDLAPVTITPAAAPPAAAGGGAAEGSRAAPAVRSMAEVDAIVARLANPWEARRMAHALYDEMRARGFRGNAANKASLVRGVYRLTSALNASLAGVEWGDERSLRLEAAMGAARESLLRANRPLAAASPNAAEEGPQEEEEEDEEALWGPPVMNALLAETARASDVAGARRVCARMLQGNVLADGATLEALLEVYAEAGDAATALGLLETMRVTELVPLADARCLALAVEACLRSAEAAAEEKEKEKQKKEGGGQEEDGDGGLHPHLVAAAELMEAAVARGLLEGSEELWRARVLLAAAATTTTDGDRGQEEAGGIEALLREMDARGFPPSIPLVADLLAAFTRRGQPERAVALFSALRWRLPNQAPLPPQQQSQPQQPPPPPLGLVLPPPTRALHQAMLASFCATPGRWPVAVSLLRKMQSRANPHLAPWQLEATAPTRPCYTAVVAGAVAGGDMRAALDVLRTMESHGMLPSQRCLATLIEGFAAARDVPGALGVWRELRRLYPQGQTSKGAFEAVLSACVADPMGVEPALGVLEDMARSGWSLDRQYYLPMMDSLGYDALNLEKVLEPFRLSVGYIDVGEDELAALLLALRRNGLSLPKAAAQLYAFGVGLPPMTMVYLRLDQPAKPRSDERKALLAGYEMRTTVAELGWLQLDSEYDSPALEAQRRADLARRLLSHFSSLREELFRRHDPAGRRLERMGLGVLAGAALAEGVGGGRGGVGAGAASAAVATEEVKRMVGSSKAGRREAKGERNRRQLNKLKEQGRVGGVAVSQKPSQSSSSSKPKQQGGGSGGKGGGSKPAAAASAAAAAASPARVVDQRQQARKLFGGGDEAAAAAAAGPPRAPSTKKSGGGGGDGKKGMGSGSGGGGGGVPPAAQSQPPQKREKR